MAYKQLSRTQLIDPNLLSAVKGQIRPAAPSAVPPVAAAPPASVPVHQPVTPGGTGSVAQAAQPPPSITKTEPAPFTPAQVAFLIQDKITFRSPVKFSNYGSKNHFNSFL